MSKSTAKGQSQNRVRVERGIYRQPNGKYAVCFMVDGRPRFRTVGYDLGAARIKRAEFVDATRSGIGPAAPQLRFARVAGWWAERYERRVEAGERRERTLEQHRYQLNKHLLPSLGHHLMRAVTVSDVAELMTDLRAKGRSEKTVASALATLQSIMRFAIRNGWIPQNPVEKLEASERPHPVRRRQRVLGREEINRLLDACAPRYRPLIATALYTGLRTSELLGLIWSDIDLRGGQLHVCAQLSRAHRGQPARRVPPKTRAAARDIPLAPQLVQVLSDHHRGTQPSGDTSWVFGTGKGTPLGHRNAQGRALRRAAEEAGLEDAGWPPLRFHDLRHTFASHLIIDVRLDIAQVSRILGHARITTTLDIYTHMFDEARHSLDVRAQMAGSAFADLLQRGGDEEDQGGAVITLPRPAERRRKSLSAREKAAVRWAT
jgi:integrase